MIEKMTKYSFILLKGKDEDFLTAVQELGVVDITRSSKPVDKESSDLMNLTRELGAAIKAIESVDWTSDPDRDKIAAEKVEIDPPDILGCYRNAVARLKALDEELVAARKDAASSKAWGEYDARTFRMLEARGFRIRFYCIPKKKFDSSWEQVYPLAIVSDDGKEVRFMQWGTWTLTETKQSEGYVMPDPAPTKTLKIGIPDAQIDDKVNGSSSTLPAIDTSSDAAFDIDFGNIPNDQRQYHLPNSGGSTSLVALIVALGFLLLSIGVAVARTARKG